MTIKETILPLVDAYADVAATHQVHSKERADLVEALDAADREVYQLKSDIHQRAKMWDELNEETGAEIMALNTENAKLREALECVCNTCDWYDRDGRDAMQAAHVALGM
jgi:hypothetical protein